MSADAVTRPGLELVKIPPRFRHSDDRNIHPVALHQSMQRGEDLFICQLAGCTKKHEGIGMNCVHNFCGSPAINGYPTSRSAKHFDLAFLRCATTLYGP